MLLRRRHIYMQTAALRFFCKANCTMLCKLQNKGGKKPNQWMRAAVTFPQCANCVCECLLLCFSPDPPPLCPGIGGEDAKLSSPVSFFRKGGGGAGAAAGPSALATHTCIVKSGNPHHVASMQPRDCHPIGWPFENNHDASLRSSLQRRRRDLFTHSFIPGLSPFCLGCRCDSVCVCGIIRRGFGEFGKGLLSYVKIK